MENNPSELDFSSAKTELTRICFLFFLSFFPNAVPSPKNRWTNQIQNKKSNPLSNVFFSSTRVVEKPCVRSNFHRLSLVIGEKLPGFGDRRLGFWVSASLLLSSTGAAVRNHTSDLISIAWSFRRLGLVRISAWVAGYCLLLSSSLFIAFWSLAIHLYVTKSSL